MLFFPECRLLGTTAGDYTLSVTSSQGEPVVGSPFAFAVRASQVSAAHSSVDLLHGSNITAGGQLQLQLVARDMYGNEVFVGL